MRVESSSCCFPRELVIFAYSRELDWVVQSKKAFELGGITICFAETMFSSNMSQTYDLRLLVQIPLPLSYMDLVKWP